MLTAAGMAQEMNNSSPYGLCSEIMHNKNFKFVWLMINIKHLINVIVCKKTSFKGDIMQKQKISYLMTPF